MHRYAIVLGLLLLGGCAFKAPMVASMTADGKYWVLKEPLEYEQPKTKQKFVVPKGFVTDFASIPRPFWVAFPPCGRYAPAAVVHDYLYWFQPATCDRLCADTLLLVAMEESGVDAFSRNAIFAGVRVGGQSSWDQNARDKASGSIRLVPEKFLDFGPNDTWKIIERRIRSASAASPEVAADGYSSAAQLPNPIERTATGQLRCLASAAHVEP